MANGVACIATDCPSGPRHIIRHEIDGILVPTERVDALAAEMAALMSDAGARMRLGNAARAIVERFSVAHVLALWDAVLQEAVAR
jgi:glycosyltransferase involved in cell wall biosynthesis